MISEPGRFFAAHSAHLLTRLGLGGAVDRGGLGAFFLGGKGGKRGRQSRSLNSFLVVILGFGRRFSLFLVELSMERNGFSSNGEDNVVKIFCSVEIKTILFKKQGFWSEKLVNKYVSLGIFSYFMSAYFCLF